MFIIIKLLVCNSVPHILFIKFTHVFIELIHFPSLVQAQVRIYLQFVEPTLENTVSYKDIFLNSACSEFDIEINSVVA